MPGSKTIRDAVHGDIWLSAHEVAVVDTRVFQRLHGIKQLALSHLVFPNATHTRFEHVIGCVRVAERIVGRLRHHNKAATRLTEDVTEKIRMAALLHDIAHIPFGHTLEDELAVVEEHHDASRARLDRFASSLKEELQVKGDEDATKALGMIDYAFRVIETVKWIDADFRARSLPRPDSVLPDDEWFVADIIGNTICADLLDYARRDMRAAGLREDYDDRLYSYFDLAVDQEGRTRLAVRIASDKGLRLDAVSDVLYVLRMRYTLSEKVLFHHAKNVASAMLGELLSYIEFGPAAFDQLTDDQVLPWIHSQAEAQGLTGEQADAAARLLYRLQSRQLYKTVFRVGPAQQAAYEMKNSKHLGEAYAKVAARRELQAEIRQQIPQLRLGDVIVYSPRPDMRLKEIWVNVLARYDEDQCRPLRREQPPYLPQVVLDEVKALETKYQALWAWTIQLSPEMLNYAFAIQAFLQQKLQVANDPFLQAHLERQPQLLLGGQVMERAPGEYRVQAKAVEIALREKPDLRAASGPPVPGDFYDDVIRRAREELFPSATALG